MRRLGIVLLLVGAIGFLVASSQRSGYDSVEGAFKTTFSRSERSKMDLWSTGRWVMLAVGVVGVALLVMPARKA